MGSETLMRRRLDAMRRFADFLSDEARAAYNVSARRSGPLDVAGLIVAGGLIETMIEWLEGRLDRPAEDVIEDYTRLCTASLEAAIPERRT
jgi:hypothetical protein